MSKVDEINARRAARRAALAEAEAEQFEKDLEELDALEIKHGDGAVGSVKLDRFVPGATTRVFFRAPDDASYKRYTDTYGRATTKQSASGQRDSVAQLARDCWLYPTDENAKKSLTDAFPGLLVSVGLAAAKKAEAEKEDAGKD